MIDEFDSLNVAAWEPRSIVNGPGERFVLWVQGCPFRCPGCFNQDFLPFVERRRMQVNDIMALIGKSTGIEGVTYSGGEPFSHPMGLYHLSQQVKQAGLTIVCYSGYTLEEIERSTNPWVKRLIGMVDLLIDGRYERDKLVDAPWRGSANQRVHLLSDAYRNLSAETVNDAGRQVELIIGANGFSTTGIFDDAFIARLEQILNQPIPTAANFADNK